MYSYLLPWHEDDESLFWCLAEKDRNGRHLSDITILLLLTSISFTLGGGRGFAVGKKTKSKKDTVELLRVLLDSIPVIFGMSTIVTVLSRIHVWMITERFV